MFVCLLNLMLCYLHIKEPCLHILQLSFNDALCVAACSKKKYCYFKMKKTNIRNNKCFLYSKFYPHNSVSRPEPSMINTSTLNSSSVFSNCKNCSNLLIFLIVRCTTALNWRKTCDRSIISHLFLYEDSHDKVYIKSEVINLRGSYFSH